MKAKVTVPYKCRKLLKPSRKILHFFKLRFKKPLFIRALRLCRHQPESAKTHHRRCSIGLLSILRSLKRYPGDMDRLMELKSFSDAGYHKAPFPSPVTPAYVRMTAGGDEEEVVAEDDVINACRSFENYLAEMIVEEGKMKDLTDVEELLQCWKCLKSPIFIDLVCRFYGELSKDLFPNNNEQEINI